MPVGFEQFRCQSDDDWIATILRSRHEPVIDGVTFPGFPSEELQTNSVGVANDYAILGAGQFYKAVKALYRRVNGGGLDDATILDFGIGWGRIARLFARDAGIGRLYGVDPFPLMLDLCRETRVPAAVSLTTADGVLPFRDGLMDLVYAYSVFTHLPEAVATHWMGEIHRALRPGGLVVITLQPPSFLEFVRSLTAVEPPPIWLAPLQAKLAAQSDAGDRAAAGEFVYFPTGGGPHLPPSIYGDAVIPRAFIDRVWADRFQVLEYPDSPEIKFQAVVALVKR
ncbi:MAG: class I SAM-dependent methyltransferase [Alphaproteobacteria bacterium]|nr:MAG: class I SAM-dependent methyltransferase [Alphaproteobacteria bacterium]